MCSNFAKNTLDDPDPPVYIPIQIEGHKSVVSYLYTIGYVVFCVLLTMVFVSAEVSGGSRHNFEVRIQIRPRN